MKRSLDGAAAELAKAKQDLANPELSSLVRERVLLKAQESHRSSSRTFLDHKASCSTCRTRDSVIRPRYPLPN
ncbi:MAG: hypothetical protein KGK08_01115 [Acidobacteriota bacterium]|nr:hypothetical protein [Acidobacteriota bacterium]